MNNNARPLVVKYGGNALPQPGACDPVLDELAALGSAGTALVVVHGGGPEIDAELARRGVTTRRIDGLRVTDDATLDVTEAVLCATVNKRLVRALHARGARAAGISGQDGPTLIAQPLDRARFGHVGEIAQVETGLLHALLSARFVPVVAPLAASSDGALNVNADLAAAALAVALDAQALIFLTNVDRVLADPNDRRSGIDVMTTEDAMAFYRSASCAAGMKPKMEAAILAASSGIDAFVAGAGRDAVARALGGEATRIAATALRCP